MKFKGILEAAAAAKIDWAKELKMADAATKGSNRKVVAGSDDSPLIHDKAVGLYKADPSRNVMSELEVQERANYYIKQYMEAGYAVQDMHKNADGSYGFTTIKSGIVKHHTFHKTAGHAVSAGGLVKDDSEDSADQDNEKIVKTQDDTQVKRGRPAGALGAAKKADAGMGGRSLQDILVGKINQKMPAGKRRLVKFKESTDVEEAVATDKQHKDAMDTIFKDPNTLQTMKNLKRRDQDSDFDQAQKDKFLTSLKTKATGKNTNEELEEMSMGTTKNTFGKKVEWINHPNIGHSVTVGGVPLHTGFLDSKSAAALYAKHSAT